jgi:hypothetical protein
MKTITVPRKVRAAVESFRQSKEQIADLVIAEGAKALSDEDRERLIEAAFEAATALDTWLRALPEGDA